MTTYDVAVLGGGPAGIAAAVAAARAGARTALLEQYGFLGGMATAGLVTPISEFRKNGKQVIGGIPWELMERMHALGGAVLDYPIGNVPFDAEIYKLAAQRMVLESGVTLYLHTKLAGCACAGDSVIRAEAVAPGGLMGVEAQTYIDCTPDAALAFSAGAPMQPLPDDSEDLQPATLIFRLAGVDTNALEKTEPREENTRYYQQAIQEKLLSLRQAGVAVPPFGGPWFCTVLREGIVNVNITRAKALPVDPIAVTQAECLLREQAFEFAALLKQHFPPFRQSYVLSTGVQAGYRESRRLSGAHILTGEELLAPVCFPDSIARCAHPVDIHHAGDHGQSVRFLREAGYIPYRALYTKKRRNLLVAGRCISADRVAFASIRVQASVMAVGQAAGTAAARCARENAAVWEIASDALQAELLAQGALL